MPRNLRDRLADARLYLCTDARKRQGDLPEFLDAVLGGRGGHRPARGTRAWRRREELAAPRGVRGRLRAGTARCSPSTTAPTWPTRPGPTCCTSARATSRSPRPARSSATRSLIGRSSHAEAETAAAAVGPRGRLLLHRPVLADPHQARPARARPRRWCVTPPRSAPTARGSPSAASTLDNLDEVLEAGARRVVVVRALTEAPDPGAAAADVRRSGCAPPGRRGRRGPGRSAGPETSPGAGPIWAMARTGTSAVTLGRTCAPVARAGPPRPPTPPGPWPCGPPRPDWTGTPPRSVTCSRPAATSYSFEFCAPKTDEGRAQLWKAIRQARGGAADLRLGDLRRRRLHPRRAPSG